MEYTVFPVTLGYSAVVADDKGLARFYLPVENNHDAVNEVLREYPGAIEKVSPLLAETRDLVKAYFKGLDTRFNKLPVSLGNMGEFGRKVLRAVSAIPYGETRTYKWAAAEAGEKDGARAAGNALNKNPLPVIIPCHRVIQSGGETGGYSAGLQWKLKLLQIEKTLK
jgi:methylated-DNA-[protein]-cysteine S-methyltransferase